MCNSMMPGCWVVFLFLFLLLLLFFGGGGLTLAKTIGERANVPPL